MPVVGARQRRAPASLTRAMLVMRQFTWVSSRSSFAVSIIRVSRCILAWRFRVWIYSAAAHVVAAAIVVPQRQYRREEHRFDNRRRHTSRRTSCEKAQAPSLLIFL